MERKKKLVVFTGAGMSADSGLATFRGGDGLWDNYPIEEICTPEALIRDRNKVIGFYNKRRKEVLEKQPNAGHRAIAGLEKYFDVEVITQNIDDLHERAGSSRVTHLHGELRKLRSSADPDLVYPIEGWEQDPEARCEKGSLLRPFVVFFGESVPMFEKAAEIASTADILLVVGTSLAVYPAASLLHYVKPGTPIYLVDPGEPELGSLRGRVEHLRQGAAAGVPVTAEKLIEKYSNQIPKPQ